MALTTAFTELMGVEHPIALAPMGGAAGGALAAAVSNGGGLGLVGGAYGDPAWLERELAIVKEATTKPWGVGFLSWSAKPEAVKQTLEYEPATVLISFGDPRELAEPVLAAGVPLIIQVTSIAEAERALEIGAHVLVAQGGEAGGHGGERATLPFVPVVVDLAGDTPVLAAGGIADGRGVAAALVLGATGALLGTRFQASAEALVTPQVAQALVDGRSEDTERNRVLDIARRSAWPERYAGRALRNTTVDQWRGREDELAADEKAKDAYEAAVAANDMGAVAVWAGESVDLITDLPPAAELVGTIATEAERALRQATRFIDRQPRLRGEHRGG